jgi:uncharacterized phage protein (TIGR01671 family)
MREIKFRAWVNDLGDEFMVYMPDLEFMDNGLWFPFERHSTTLIQLMQYTGLKDKNGKEIYEGDIMRVDDRETSIGEIVFDDAEFKLKMVKFKNVLWKLKYKNQKRSGEVIGNIYENPELI